MKQQSAFTTLEMIITLGLVAIIMCITGPQISRSNKQLGEQRFWQSFRQEWQAAQARAQILHQGTAIYYYPPVNAIVFKGNGEKEREVQLPTTLRVKDFSPIEMKENGYVQPGTRRFYSQIDQCNYRIVVQMARGEYDVKKDGRLCNGR